MLNVLEHGAVGDGVTLNTTALQSAIDGCAAAGGGTLRFPPGRYLTGGLILRSRITLNLENGAVLLGSTDLSHYRHWNPVPEAFVESAEGLRALLFALDEHSICVCGSGTIDGQGPQFGQYRGLRAGRPRNIWFGRCRGVAVDGVHLRCSGFWMQHYLKCTQLRLTNLDVWNHDSCNNDGMDIDCCRDVEVRNCRIDSADDAICLKSGNNAPTENVLISNCITRTHCNHFKTGTESNGGFRNVRADGLVMVPSERRESHPGTQGADYRGACGIALGCVDGGCLENITVQNVTMDQVRVPFFVRLGDRGRPIAGSGVRQPVAFARNIRISGVQARHASGQGCFLVGLPDARLHDVHVQDCDLEFAGAGDAALLTREVPQNRAGYPSMEMFGNLPAYGVFARDVDGLCLERLRFRHEAAEPRPALAWQYCNRVRVHEVSSESLAP